MELTIGNISAIELAEQYGTPLYVYDQNTILKNIQNLKESFPNTNICYAVKANSNLEILKLVASQGLGADCSNGVEIELAELAGFDMNRSIYTGVNPSNEDLKKALESGIKINLDDISILKRILKFGKPEIISFRINPGFGKGKFPSIVVGGKGTKFGMNEDLAREAYRQAKNAGIEKFGIHMMTGSGVNYEEYFTELTLTIQNIARRIGDSVGIKFDFMDIGGGIGVPYEPHEKDLDIKKIGTSVEKAFTYDGKLMIEPGKYIIAEAGVLLTKVTTIKNNFIGVDAGMSTLIRPALYGAYHPIVLANNLDAKLVQEANIVGPICENTDFFAKNRAMPKVEEGNILAIKVAGAYCYAMASPYNGVLRPAEVMIDKEEHWVIRKRETVQDLI
ncbi:MAG: diaminopimelate decarboxylase [archaeon]|nr:diaminopimelate decarboxylase [Nanoarchaeota archaeon]